MDARQLLHKTRRDKVADLAVPRALPEIEKVHSRAVARVDRRVGTGEDGAEEGAHQMDALRRIIRGRVVFRELHDLGAGKPLDCGRAGAQAQRLAESRIERGDLGVRRGVHPDRGDGPRKRAVEPFDKRPAVGAVGKCGERGRPSLAEIHAAVLLAVPADGVDLRRVERVRELLKDLVERRHPQARIRLPDEGIRVRQETVRAAERRKVFPEVDGDGRDDRLVFDIVDERLDALCA